MRPGALAAVVAAAAVAGCGGGNDGGATSTASTAKTATAAAQSNKAAATPRPTVRQLIGQHMVYAYAGAEPPAGLVRRIRHGEAAGVILFDRNVGTLAHLRRTIARLQALPRAVDPGPLLIMVDQEGGPVRRVPGPPAASAAQTTTTAAAHASGSAAGRLLHGAGVNVDLAPVVDVARPGSALAAEGRTYGRDAKTVTARAGAFAAGLRDHGVAPVLKHFPGLGAATINTDDGAARVDLPLRTLRGVDLKPYEKTPDHAGLMVSTAIYPRVDPRPAVFSRRWVTTILRDGRPDVPTLTDDLQTPAVARYGSPAQLAYFALRAGIDVPLFAKTYGAGTSAADGLLKAVRSGALTRAQLQAGADRLARWRAEL
ncbi:MAG TPA: glycoside hydrolase family 3 N-terminal domain-containing protein [Baekduia sp.]